MNLIYQETAWINLHCGCEWGVCVCVCDASDDGQNRQKVGRTPPLFINPFMPRPSAVMLLSNLRWSRSLSQASISERRGPDRARSFQSLFSGDESQLLLFPLSKYSFNPRSSFQLNIWWSVSKCCCDCRECSQKRNKHFWKYLDTYAFFP